MPSRPLLFWRYVLTLDRDILAERQEALITKFLPADAPVFRQGEEAGVPCLGQGRVLPCPKQGARKGLVTQDIRPDPLDKVI